jgi:hypothetical protein
MELIPITDFDKRYFPEVSEEEKINFILHSNNFERISMKKEEVQSHLLIPQRAHPAVSGQMRCFHLVLELAPNPELIPHPDLITPATFDKHFPWLKSLHKNLLFDFAKKGEELINLIDYPSKEELGKFRELPLLATSFKSLATHLRSIKDNLENPRLMEQEDWQKLEQKIYHASLDIACIKPFRDGSNRIARLTENLFRLNSGLKFKIHEDKDDYLREVQEHQDRYYKF